MAVRFSDEERQRYLDAFEASGRNYAEAARKLGVARSTMQYHINQAGLDQKHEMVAMPSFVVDGDEEESIDSLLSRRRQAFDLNQTVSEEEKSGKPVQGPGLPSFVKDRKAFVSADCIEP